MARRKKEKKECLFEDCIDEKVRCVIGRGDFNDMHMCDDYDPYCLYLCNEHEKSYKFIKRVITESLKRV